MLTVGKIQEFFSEDTKTKKAKKQTDSGQNPRIFFRSYKN